MNQTVTVNISGLVFHIEVDAYEDLKQYLNKIRSYFKNSEESEEIMTDIEARIAELFSKKISSNNQVINMNAVEEVITVMGKPEQYVDEDTVQEEQNQENSSSSEQIYTSEKKLFRDPDDRMIGGVATGLATYMGIEAIWLRLFFVIALFIGFGFLLYIILWIVIPEAKTTSDKLHMKGKPINIDNIGKNFKDEADKMSDNFRRHGKQYGKRAESAIETTFNFIGQLLNGVFNVLGKFFGVVFLIIGLIFLTSTTLWVTVGESSIFSFSEEGVFAAVRSPELFNLIFPSSDMYHIFLIVLVVVIGIPFIAMVYAGLKLLFNIKTHFSVGLSMFILWLVGVICCVFFGIYISKDQMYKDYSVESKILEGQYSNYELACFDNNIEGEEILEANDLTILMNNDSIYMDRVSLNVKRSETDKVQIKTKYKSRGSSKKDAQRNASAIICEFTIKDSLISFNEFIRVPKQDRIRGQEAKVEILLPIGKTIYLSNSLENIIYDIDNVTRTRDRNMLNKKWVMLERGLTCLDCNEINGITTLELDSIRANKLLIEEVQ